MASSKGFICPECGRDHDGLPRDLGYKLPDDVWAISASERSRRAKFDTDLCRFGDRYFIRCILYVPFNFSDDAFGWGVWAEVSAETFSRYRKMFNKDGSNEPSHSGRLANALKFYPDANEEAVTIKFKNAASRPTLETLAASTSSLAIEQRNGIDLARYHDILRGIGAL